MAEARYVQSNPNTANSAKSPIHAVIVLYEGAIRFMEAGKVSMLQNDADRQGEFLNRAQKILTELIECLDLENGSEVAKNLLSLYSYVLNELVIANKSCAPAGIDRGIRVLTALRESWTELEASIHLNGDSNFESAA